MKKILLVSILAALQGFAQDPQTKDLPQTSKNPPPFDADLFKRDKQVMSGHVEFLFWRVQEGGLDYALVMNGSAWGPTANYAQGKYKTQTWNGDAGFRAALSFFRAPRYWEIKWEYTRFTGAGHSHVNKPTPPTTYLTGTWPQIIPVLSSANSRIHLNYNVFDLTIDRFFNPNPHMRLRLMAVGSLAWMEQDWVVQYYDTSSNRTKTQNKWEYIAGGIKTGMMIDWFWFYDFYMVLKATAGGYIGMYDNRSTGSTSYPQPASNPGIPFRNSSYNDVRPSFTFQIQIGPSWQRSTKNNRFEVFAGYEINGWLNLQEIYRTSAGTPSDPKLTFVNSSMLVLQGLTTRLTVDF